MTPKCNTPEEMETMRRWLHRACALFDVDPDIIDELESDLLAMAGHTAHELSRPGTPLTAFLVGMGVGGTATCDEGDREERNARIVAKTRELIARVRSVSAEDIAQA